MAAATSAHETRTTCPYCGTGCGLLVRSEGGRLRAVRGDPLHPVNRGRTCRKPLELPAAVHARDRATVPLWRDDRERRFEKVDWEQAIARLAEQIATTIDRHGPDSVAFYISGQLTTEDYYVVNKLAKGFLGTNNVDSNSRLCMSSAVAGYAGAFGSDGPPASYSDIALADCFLLVGTNTAACHPIVWSRIRDRQAEGATVICVDPRPTETAVASDIHLALRPGTDIELLLAMFHVVVREQLVDRHFVARCTHGFEEAAALAAAWPPERAAAACGVAAADIERAARLFARRRSLALWSMGANQSRVGTLKNRAIINLCLATGNVGRPGRGPLSLTGQPNAMGGREVGGLAHLLPGYRRVDRAEDRAAIERSWGLRPGSISPRPGLAAVELFDAVRAGRVRAIWIAATNPVVSLPRSYRAREALARAELVVVQDAHHPTETSALAHAVLPAAAWPEKDGTMTCSERRLSPLRRALDPPGEALPDWRIWQKLAHALGFGAAFAWESADEVFAEFAALTAGRPCDISGVDRELLVRRGSVQWPLSRSARAQGDEDGAPRLYEDGRFNTPDGRARFCATPPVPPDDPLDESFPLVLVTGRVAEHWHTLSRTGKSPKLRALSPAPVLELAPGDARRAGVRDGDEVRVVSRRGSVRLPVRISPALAEGVAFAPFHWGALHAPPGAGTVNDLTNPAVDPESKQPELKFAAVRLEPVRVRGAAKSGAGSARQAAGSHRRARRRRRRIVVVGGGPAAVACCEEVRRRKRPESVDLTVLAAEPHLPYDRVRLSTVLAGGQSASALALRPREWWRAQAIDLRLATPCTAIDVDRGEAVAADGSRYRYDTLVLATGSHPVLPPIAGIDGEHVIAFRTIQDCERILAAARSAQRAVVVGGGLLGIEAAAGLAAHGVAVTVVEGAAHILPQQLDAAAAAIVAGELAARGIASECGTTVERIDRRTVTLGDGRELAADLVVVACGVRPASELARATGIGCRRGIVVDEQMRTDAPRVLACGECAEHEGVVAGLVAPATSQARVAAAVACGDPCGYHGTVPAARLKVAGLDVFAVGVSRGDPELEVAWRDGRGRVYRKLVFARDGALAGAVFVGDLAGAPTVAEAVRQGEAVDPGVCLPEALRGSATGVELDPETTVCSCNHVNAGTIREAVRKGARTLAEIQRATRASTGCGSCAADVERILREVAA